MGQKIKLPKGMTREEAWKAGILNRSNWYEFIKQEKEEHKHTVEGHIEQALSFWTQDFWAFSFGVAVVLSCLAILPIGPSPVALLFGSAICVVLMVAWALLTLVYGIIAGSLNWLSKQLTSALWPDEDY